MAQAEILVRRAKEPRLYVSTGTPRFRLEANILVRDAKVPPLHVSTGTPRFMAEANNLVQDAKEPLLYVRTLFEETLSEAVRALSDEGKHEKALELLASELDAQRRVCAELRALIADNDPVTGKRRRCPGCDAIPPADRCPGIRHACQMCYRTYAYPL